MHRTMSDPKAMPLPLQPRNGEIYGYVFENPLTQLARNLFWNLYVEFEPVHLDGEELHCSLGVDWLTLPLQGWRDLDGASLADVQQPELVECSLYLFEQHHWAELKHLKLRQADANAFEADYSIVANVDDGSGQRLFNVHGKATLRLVAISVSDTLAPTEVEASTAVSEFIALDELTGPQKEASKFIFRPNA